MKARTGQHHIIDLIFILSLFCMFAISSVLLILLGADVYQKTLQRMAANDTSRTSVLYLTEKIRQTKAPDSLHIVSKNGTQVLMLTTTIQDITYATSLYEYNGYLYELFARTDLELSPDAGQPIVELHDLSFSKITPDILEIRFTDSTDTPQTLYVHTNDKETLYE